MTRTPPSWPDILGGALVTFHRFDDRGGEGVNFIEVRVAENAAQEQPEGGRDAS